MFTKRHLACLALLGSLTAAAATDYFTSPSAHAAPSVACAIKLRFGSQTCYAASQAAEAGRRAPFSAWTPISAVSAISGVQLNQVGVVAAPKGRASQVYYLFGTFKAGQDLTALGGSSSHSLYVVVQEVPAMIVPVRGVVSRPQRSRPWQFTAAVPGRRLSLVVTTNGSRSLAQRLGSSLVASAKRG